MQMVTPTDGNPESKPPASPKSGAGPPRSPASPAPRVLIVEDEYFVALEMEAVLLAAGATVIEILDSAESAIEIGLRELPDLVVTDITLTGKLNGLDVARAMQERGIPFIIASAHSDASTRERAMGLRPSAWLIKPFTSAELTLAALEALERGPPN